MSKKIHSKLTPYSKPYSPEKLDFLEEQIHISDHVISDLLRNAPYKLEEKIKQYALCGIEQLNKQCECVAAVYFQQCLRVLEPNKYNKLVFNEDIVELVYINLAYLHQKMWNFELSLKYLKKAVETIKSQISNRKSTKTIQEYQQLIPDIQQLHYKTKLIKYYLKISYLASQISQQDTEFESLLKFLEILKNITQSLVVFQKITQQKNSELLLKLNASLREVNYESLKNVSINGIKVDLQNLKKHRHFFTFNVEYWEELTLEHLMKLSPILDLRNLEEQKLIGIQQFISHEHLIMYAMHAAAGLFALSKSQKITKQHKHQSNVQNLINKNYSKFYILKAITILLQTKLSQSNILKQILQNLKSNHSIWLEKSEYFPPIPTEENFRVQGQIVQQQTDNLYKYDQYSTDYQVEQERHEIILGANSHMKANLHGKQQVNSHAALHNLLQSEIRSRHVPEIKNLRKQRKSGEIMEVLLIIQGIQQKKKKYRGRVFEENDPESMMQSRVFRKSQQIKNTEPDFLGINSNRESYRQIPFFSKSMKKPKKKLHQSSSQQKSFQMKSPSKPKFLKKMKTTPKEELTKKEENKKKCLGEYYFPSKIEERKFRPYKAKRKEQISLNKNADNNFKSPGQKIKKKKNRMNSEESFCKILDFSP